MTDTTASKAKADPAPQAIWPDIPKPLMPYSPAVKAGGWVFVSGQLASDFETGIAPEARSANPNLGDDQALQSRFVMQTLKRTFDAAGVDMAKDLVRIWQWFPWDKPTYQDFENGDCWPGLRISPYLDVRNDYIHEPRPASTAVSIRALPVRGARIEVDAIAIDDGAATVGFPVPVGVPGPLAGYSPAVRRGDWVFLAGEVPTDWVGDYDGTQHRGPHSALAKEARINPYVWYGSEIETQTDYTLQKLAKIAEAAGSSLKRAVKADVYIGHPSDYAGMDRVWRRWFPDNPARPLRDPLYGPGHQGQPHRDRLHPAGQRLRADHRSGADLRGPRAVQPRAPGRARRRLAVPQPADGLRLQGPSRPRHGAPSGVPDVRAAGPVADALHAQERRGDLRGWRDPAGEYRPPRLFP